MVFVDTRPRTIAPTNSNTDAIHIAWFIVSVPDPTDVPNALPKSFEPVAHPNPKAPMAPTTTIHNIAFTCHCLFKPLRARFNLSAAMRFPLGLGARGAGGGARGGGGGGGGGARRGGAA